MEEVQLVRDGLGLVGDLYNGSRVVSAVMRRVNRAFGKAQEINPTLDFQAMPDEKLLFAHAAARRIADTVEMDEEVENLWARLIVDGCVNTGHYSARTLDVLKSMSAKEAQSLQRVAPYCFGMQDERGIHPELIWLPDAVDEGMMRQHFSSVFPPSARASCYAGINELINAGLAYTGAEFLNASDGIIRLHYGGAVVGDLLHDRQMAIGMYHLTREGQQLYPLVPNKDQVVHGYREALEEHLRWSNLAGPRHPTT